MNKTIGGRDCLEGVFDQVNQHPCNGEMIAGNVKLPVLGLNLQGDARGRTPGPST